MPYAQKTVITQLCPKLTCQFLHRRLCLGSLLISNALSYMSHAQMVVSTWLCLHSEHTYLSCAIHMPYAPMPVFARLCLHLDHT